MWTALEGPGGGKDGGRFAHVGEGHAEDPEIISVAHDLHSLFRRRAAGTRRQYAKVVTTSPAPEAPPSPSPVNEPVYVRVGCPSTRTVTTQFVRDSPQLSQ